jgi:N-hydroxyarylamine O-acetyltransferase
MTTHIDLASYFRRIGFSGETPIANLATLHAIVFKHTTTIPFENLNPLLQRPVLLDLASLQSKLIDRQRGGYCFEHNLLLRDVLLQMGYRVTSLAARVLWNASTPITQRSHMLLRIDLDNFVYLVDVGFGGVTSTGVLQLKPIIEQSTPHESYRLLTDDSDFILQARIGDEWRAMYRFDLQVQHPIDYQAINWYLSAHPQSHFVQNLRAALALPDRRYALDNNQLSIYYRNGSREEKILDSATAIRTVLTKMLGINTEEFSSDLDETLARIAVL